MRWGAAPESKCATIDIDGVAHPVSIRPHPAARSVKLRYDGLAGVVRITVPVGMSARTAIRMAAQHRSWLQGEVARAVRPIALCNGASLAFEGHQRRIVWDNKVARVPRIDEGTIVVGGEERSIAPRVLRWLREAARERFLADLEFYCAKAQEAVPPLGVGDPRTRWGSCSTRSGIRLNWRLVMAPIIVRRSVVAHEVAHLAHMDHSAQFYAHLDDLFDGDRAGCDRWLRQHGGGLRAIGAATDARICRSGL